MLQSDAATPPRSCTLAFVPLLAPTEKGLDNILLVSDINSREICIDLYTQGGED